jgi:SNF2 family DNA or RNA helicase
MATILTDKKAVVFKLKQPERITTVIPTSKLVKHEGNTLVAVPHKPEETKVLRNLGFDIPAPMQYYYDFPGRFKPFAAQIETASFLSMHDRAFCLNSMGLGKTVTALWAYDYMRHVKLVKKALIVCPLSTMERTWADEVFKTFPHLDYAVVYGTREKRKKILKQDVDLYIINTDGIKTIADDLKDRPDINLIIVDEIAMFRNSSTDRWKTLNNICNKQTPRRIWALTGSPVPNEPTDAWAQCRLVTPTSEDVPKYFGKFRDLVMRQISPFKWVPKDNALEVVRRCMQPAIRFSLDDCVDLPEQIFEHRDVEMSTEQKKAYKEMLTKLTADVVEERLNQANGVQTITAVNDAVKANKLVQIACGVAYGQDGEEIIIPSNHRIEVLKECIDESEGKVLVFVPLTGVLNHLKEELSKHYTVEVVCGETKKHERDQIFSAFQNTPEPRVLLANAATMSHGLTLTAATNIIWYAPVYSGEIYEQACARVRRPGQKKTTVIVHIAASEIERRIYSRLKSKQQMQGLFLDLMKEV